MKLKAAVLGHPIAHSKSPLIHEYWLDKLKMEGSYIGLDIPPVTLETRIRQMADSGYTGFNATIPHKEALLELCDDLDESAEKIGAVNTVKIEDGSLIGFNTDAYGFIENLKEAKHNFDFTDGSAFILGAGGAARAAIYGLQQAGLTKIRICNRTRDRAEKLAEEFGCDVIDWDEKDENLDHTSLLVNTTALGMSGKEALEINLHELPSTAIVYDIVYNPLITDLLEQAQDAGNPTVTGIGMLLYQAQMAFKLWTGIMPDVTPDLERLVLT